jgi:hypothetical protein
MPVFRGLAALGLLATGALAGCGTVTAGSAVAGRASLVTDLANRLSRSGTLTYSALYTMPGGASATIAEEQDPPQASYTYAGGKLVVSGQATVDCRTQNNATTCTLTAASSPWTDPITALISQIDTLNVFAPTMVIGLLTSAGLDVDAVITQHDTTIAGENATCADVSGLTNSHATEFTTCITTDGLLGSFSGVVDGKQTDITLDRYDATVAPDAFTLPAGAKVIDKRNG